MWLTPCCNPTTAYQPKIAFALMIQMTIELYLVDADHLQARLCVLRPSRCCSLQKQQQTFLQSPTRRCLTDLPALQTTFTDVTCRDATLAPYPAHHKPAGVRGYALKAFALYATSFTEVILLDADNLPVLDPALLFDTPEYKLHGSMFW